MSKLIALSCTHKADPCLTDSYLSHAVAGYRCVADDTAVQHIRLIDFHIKLCVGNDECLTTGSCPLQDQFYEVVELAKGADAMILCMPVYGGNVPAVLKIFMERLKTFMALSPRPFGDMVVCTIVHSRAMLTESALAALAPWYQRLRNRNIASLCLTKEGLADVADSPSFELCRLMGMQLAAQRRAMASTSLSPSMTAQRVPC